MVVLAALVLTVLFGAGLPAESRTYRHTDPVTGQQLLCDRCPPGTRLREHCTRSRPTVCARCGAGLFTEFWNYIPDCLRCDACSDHQRVVRPCNGSVNTVCECEAGFFWDQHFCRKHSACKPGHGVKAPGTPHRDTVCELCADGHYADVTQTQAVCVIHSSCKTDEQLLLPGSRWHSNVCASCAGHTEKGLVDLFKPVVSALNPHYGASLERLQKLVMRRLRRRRFGKRAALRLQSWSEEDEELLNLPSVLEESHLNPLADWIARRILRFQQHCANTVPQTI
ncbi:tumor necrosis factor receptor superfamily member 11B-like [Puntigrus tetrazona]|uniref:tumor necrosis factor receptor superfamily member 11B-like n=1 Tax=Puntigrus tetrazona TaxID=1606681 RepID=UPI001C892C66|nr:tumor necrosis factor receptor superfamily member 11B-like [Puntigrus tetrazona]